MTKIFSNTWPSFDRIKQTVAPLKRAKKQTKSQKKEAGIKSQDMLQLFPAEKDFEIK